MSSKQGKGKRVAAGSLGTSYDVRVDKISPYDGVKARTYAVRWSVGSNPHRKTFKNRAAADSRRSELLTAARQGIAFDIAMGVPIHELKHDDGTSWYEHACTFVDMKWDHASGNTREGIADALATVTPALLASERGKPETSAIRAALLRWSFNKRERAAGSTARTEHGKAIKWLERNTLPVSALAEGETLRAALDRLSRKLDGSPAAANTFARKRAVFHQVLEYAVERNLLDTNPLSSLKWKAPKTAEMVNPRVVVNMKQASSLLEGVRAQGRLGPHLVGLLRMPVLRRPSPGRSSAAAGTRPGDPA